MKVLIVSDSHGFTSKLREIIEKENDFDMLIHLGDGSNDICAVNELIAYKPVHQIKGNCDLSSYNLSLRFISYIDDLKFIACHGHSYNVKNDLSALFYAAKEYECRFAFYGHTHIPSYEEAENVILFNPGSVMNGCYGVLKTCGNRFSLKNLQLN